LNFKTKTRSVFACADFYLQFLIQTNKGSRNIEAMTDNFTEKHYHKIQHFISESPWSARDLMDSVAQDIHVLFQGEPAIGLLLDESSEDKKGDLSVGVSSQYCGNLGKQANCQTAVHGTLNAGEHFSIIDSELYLPQCWVDDQERCLKAGIPIEAIQYRKKTNIALAIVKRQKEAGVRFDFVAADALYGHDIDFREGLEKLNVLYVVDTHKSTRIYTEPFQLEVPQRKAGSRGKSPSIAKPNKDEISLNKYLEALQDKDWLQVIIRNGCKGTIKSLVHAKEVYMNHDGVCKKTTLIIRKTKEHKGFRIHFILSNGSLEKYSLEYLAQCQSQRFYIEQSFKEAKQNIGMYEYQVRGWLAWHHHIALSMMALAFLSMEKKENEETLPLLSYRDIRDAIIEQCMDMYLTISVNEKIAKRHMKKQKDVNRYYKE
jgi:SRSO17 transposase